MDKMSALVLLAAALLARPAFGALSVEFSQKDVAELRESGARLSAGAFPLVERATALGNAGKNAEACAGFSDAVDLDGGNLYLRMLHAQTCWAAGKVDAGIASAREAGRLHPNSSLPMRVAATQLLLADRLQEAEAAAREAVRRRLGDARSRAILGGILVRRKRFQQAVAELTLALEIDPSYYRMDYDLALAYEALERLEPALEHARLFLAKAGLQWGDPEMANGRALVELILSKLNEQAAPDDGISEELVGASADLRMGQHATAARRMIAVLKKAPRLAHAYYLLSLGYTGVGNDEAAVKAARRAAELRPSSAQYAYRHAAALRYWGEPQEALRVLARVVKMAPKWDDPYYEQALNYRLLKRRDEAVAALRKAVALNPEHGEAQIVLGHILLRQGRAQEALAALDKGQYLRPNAIMPDLDLGLIYAKQGKATQAEYHLKTFLRRSKGRVPDDDEFRREAERALAKL